MLRAITAGLLWCFVAATGHGAEKLFDFTEVPVNTTPTNFSSVVTREGKPGTWHIIKDEVKTSFAPLTPGGGTRPVQHVLAQLSQDTTDEHFPILLYDGDTYGDFTFSTKFKIVSGQVERMAGIVFRAQDERNYYVLRASAAGNNFRFYKVINGARQTLIGPSLKITAGEWHELSVTCKGNLIQCFLDGQQPIPDITDNAFSSGKIGFWTKSDSVSYFTDAKVIYTPRESLAQNLVKDMMERYSRLRGMKIFAPMGGSTNYSIIASTDETELRKPAPEFAASTVTKNGVYIGRTKETVAVTLPLHDRNGDAVAAVQVIMVPFIGQTEQAFIVRALPVAKYMEQHFRSAKELAE